eukprot:g1932.t1
MANQSSDEMGYPISVLIAELKDDDVTIRLNSIRRLGIIARALGEERTRNELIPFLNEANDDQDEVLLALAEELGDFVQYIGGKDHAHVLLAPLETLSTVEETVVRDKAVQSLCNVGHVLSTKAISNFFLPLIKRLASGEWFTARVSACGLFSAAYPLADESSRGELRSLFSNLIQDETPMVRRAAAQNLGKFVHEVEPKLVVSELLPLFSRLTQDDQDSVLLLAVGSCGPFAKQLSPEDSYTLLLPIVQKLSEDKSWRVRYQIAEVLCDVSNSFTPEMTRDELTPIFTRLLRDAEPEVRSAAARKVALFCKKLEGVDIIDNVLPCVMELSTDNSQYVRASLASVVMELTSKIGKQATITHLLPVTLLLQKDDFAEVRLSVIRNLDQVNQVIGVESLAQSLLPSLKELSEDDNWRVRLAVIEHIPLLAKQLGPKFFQEKMGAQWMQWLEDQVASIREAGTIALQKVAQEFGPAWAKEYLVPQVIKMIESTHYLYRITVLVTISMLAVVVDGDVVHGQMLPAIINLAKDPVPNVRFSVAKNLQKMIQEAVFEKNAVSQVVQPCLKELSEDADADVMFFANQALGACERLLTV